MRITGGSLKGRLIEVPKKFDLRPTTERVREAVFSTLYSFGVESPKSVLDLYAGSGMFGVESLSRGAEQAVFVEKHKALAKLLESNLNLLGLGSRSKVENYDVLSLINRGSRYLSRFDLIFVDPPYAEHPGGALIIELLNNGWVASGGKIVVESASGKEQFADIYESSNSSQQGCCKASLLKQKQYGDTQISYFGVG